MYEGGEDPTAVAQAKIVAVMADMANFDTEGNEEYYGKVQAFLAEHGSKFPNDFNTDVEQKLE